ncbi:MAG: hypothetical protein KA586_00185 [Candidatus Promineofilum sp.]|nr:hypothetical protein [Promineifilum sp.]
MSQSSSTSRFDRGAWLHLLVAAALVALALASSVYRVTLPTDGWHSAPPDDFDAGAGFTYQHNVMGAPSGLRPGDYLTAVEGISLETLQVKGQWQLREQWRAGTTVRYTVLRDGRAVALEVPLVHWDVGLLARRLITPGTLPDFLGLVLFLGISFLAFWRRPDNPAARALLMLAAPIFAVSMVDGLPPSMIPDNIFPAATLAVVGTIFSAFTVLLPPAFIRFALMFPHPSPILVRHPWLAWLPYGIGLLVLGAFFRQQFVLGWAWTALSALMALVILIAHAFTMRDAVSRAQLRWGLGGMIAGVGLFLLTYIPVFFNAPALVAALNLISSLSFGVMGVALGMAVLRYRLFDIDVIIRKTTSYAILTALLALVYFGSVVILQRLLSPITGDSTAAVVLSTLLIAAMFLPLRRRVQAIIDRRFFRKKYDAEQVLARFAATARDETDLDALTAELARVIQETMEPESVSVWLRPMEKRTPAGGDGSSSPVHL